MGSSSKHILDKIDRIREKGDQRRADRVYDVRFGANSLYKPAKNPKVFTAEEVALTKAFFQKKLKKRNRNTWILWLVTISVAFICLYLFNLFFTSFAF